MEQVDSYGPLPWCQNILQIHMDWLHEKVNTKAKSSGKEFTQPMYTWVSACQIYSHWLQQFASCLSQFKES